MALTARTARHPFRRSYKTQLSGTPRSSSQTDLEGVNTFRLIKRGKLDPESPFPFSAVAVSNLHLMSCATPPQLALGILLRRARTFSSRVPQMRLFAHLEWRWQSSKSCTPVLVSWYMAISMRNDVETSAHRHPDSAENDIKFQVVRTVELFHMRRTSPLWRQLCFAAPRHELL